MAILAALPSTPTLEELLEAARHRIEVTDPELAEARTRRDAIAAALRAEFPGSEIYVNGSVAHGDALTPLTDVDVGVIVAGAEGEYGPGRRGPLELMNRAAEAIREGLKPVYGDLSVQVQGRKRSVLIRFRDPVTPGQPDFTADVIVAVENLAGEGLFIPRAPTWDRSHPQKHTAMVHKANIDSGVTYARVVRLLKHWNRSNGKPLCSWNIKALGLGCLRQRTGLLVGLRTWFNHAADELQQELTQDPAGVAAHPIKINEQLTRTEVVRKLRRAAEDLAHATQREAEGYPALAQDLLAKVFNDEEMLPRPDRFVVLAEESRRIKDQQTWGQRRPGAAALITGTGEGAWRPRRDVDSWAP